MIKAKKYYTVFFLVLTVLLSGCTNSSKLQKDDRNPGIVQSTPPGQPDVDNSSKDRQSPDSKATPAPKQAEVDLQKVKPNEAGKIMVVMFHNFVESFTPSKSDDGQYTTTFDEFGKLLQTLYDKGYRLISFNDYLNNNIPTPAGFMPMLFTFDDGSSGQFNLVEENGRLVANSRSAVGIMEEFNRTHPDFGLEGTFYVNLGLKTFDGKGSMTERLKYITDAGFEIGNHTLTHIDLSGAKSAEQIVQNVGGNQKKLYEYLPSYKMQTLALPYGGQPSKELQGNVASGEYEGVKYENSVLLKVGAGPAVSPVSVQSTPLAMNRVRATGMKAVDYDLNWWLGKLSREEQYVSDGNPDTVSVPAAKEAEVDTNRLRGKKLVLY